MGKRKADSLESSPSSGASDRKSKKPKKDKHKHKDKRDKQARKQEKKLLKEAKKLVARGQSGAAPPPPAKAEPAPDQVDQISPDDYFRLNAEFTAWLREAKGQSFGDLSAEAARSSFLDFVELWNARRLSGKYYRGMEAPTMRRSNHQWGIRGGAAPKGVGLAAAVEDEEELQAAARAAGRQSEADSKRKWRADRKVDLDELLPKATGREAVIEKKAARREAGKERDASPDLVRLPGGGDVMGGDDSFAAAKARQAKQQAWQSQKRAVQTDTLQQRQAAARAAEDSRMQQFRALAAAGPISIPKRQ